MEAFISCDFKQRACCLQVYLLTNYVRANSRNLVTLTLLTPQEQKDKNLASVYIICDLLVTLLGNCLWRF